MAGSNQQSSESAMQAMEWMRNMADQLLNHSKTMWESSFTTARHAFEEVEQQASEIRGRLLSLTEATLPTASSSRRRLCRPGVRRSCSSFRASSSVGRRS